jgi:hypothetical protein
VALTLLAVISGGLSMAFSTSLRAAGAIQRRAGAADERRAVVDRLRADLEGAWLRPESSTTWFRASNGAGSASRTTTGEGGVLELTTARPVSIEAVRADEGADGAAGPQSDVAQVVWQIEPQEDGTTALVRWERTPPDPQYLEQGGLEMSQDPAMVRTVMLRSVMGFTLRFFDGTDWLEEWDTAPQTDGAEEADSEVPPVGLPRAVEVSVFQGTAQALNGARRQTRLTAAEEVPTLTMIVALPAPTETVEEEVAP